MIGILVYHAWLLFQLHFVSRTKTVSIKELLHVFAVGATVAVLGNLLIQGVAVRLLGSDLVIYTVGPITEEVLKIAFVVYLFFFTDVGKSASVIDGILLAAVAGAGYGFTEDAVRAVGLGLSEMNEFFPAYNLANLPGLLTAWLPSERNVSQVSSYVSQFVPGHLMWTALVGFGLGIARKLGRKNLFAYLVPVILLLWVIVDHSLVNNSDSWLSFLYPWYGKGLGIRYALTFGIIIALILDEILINRYLPKDEKLLLPGEKKRSLAGELKQTITNLQFGKKHWFALLDYFRVRRQIAFAAAENDEAVDLKKLLQIRRNYTIASASLAGKPVFIPPNLSEIWQGPPLKFGRLNTTQKILTIIALGLVLTQLYNMWLLLFSVYLPTRLASTIANSPLTIVVGIIGYLVVVYQIIAFYRNKQWQSQDQDNRVVGYTNTLLTHTAVFNVVWNLPLFFGRHPLMIDKFLWSQFLRFLEFYRDNLRPWLGGALSAGINFIPVFGNVKSGFEAWSGYDYVSGKEVRGMDRVWAALGAIPVAGNILRAMRYLPKSLRLVQGLRYRATVHRAIKPLLVFDETVGKFKGKIDFGKAVKEDYSHAFDELRKQYAPIEQMKVDRMARERQSSLEDWVSDGWMKQVDSGHYQKTLNAQPVDIFTGKSLNKFGDLVQNGAGQVTIDHASQTVSYDGISTNYSSQKSDHLVKALGDLQKQYPGSTIMYNQMFDAGASVLHIQPPSGQAFQTLRMPIQSVGSR
ncbi:MAG: PrsW family glutamic-type intramembrane protease [Patescibacteria group bacterium]